MLQTANPPLSGGIMLRRVIIIQDGEGGDSARARDYLRNGIEDSDGTFTFIDPKYVYTKSGHFDIHSRTDKTLLHEWGHTILHLPDHYFLDFSVEKSPKFLQDIPPYLLAYFPYARNDIGNNLMNGQKPNFLGEHEARQIFRRIQRGISHDFDKIRYESSWVFPNEVPHSTTLSFDRELSHAEVQIFRTTGNEKNKRLIDEPVFQGRTDIDGKVNIGNPFTGADDRGLGDKFINVFDGTLLLIAKMPNGKLFIRWMDVRDFNLAFWQGYKDQVTMNLNAISAEKDIPPEEYPCWTFLKVYKDFDWTIEYSEEKTASDRKSE